MGLVSAILGLPLAPVRGVVALGQVIQRQVEQEMRNPASVRRQLEEAEEARAEGEISEAEEDEIQRQAVSSIVEPKSQDKPDSHM